jgi:hypothetical protein
MTSAQRDIGDGDLVYMPLVAGFAERDLSGAVEKAHVNRRGVIIMTMKLARVGTPGAPR